MIDRKIGTLGTLRTFLSYPTGGSAVSEPEQLDVGKLADKIRLATKPAKQRSGKRRYQTAALGLTLVERLKAASVAYRTESWLIFLKRKTPGWKRLEAYEREFHRLMAQGEHERNGA